MRQSLKTRLLSAAYKAACALAERVFAFTEQLRQQKEYSYQDDLFDYRDALLDELDEGEALAAALAKRNAEVRASIVRTNDEIYGPEFTPRPQVPEGAGIQDFDDLPAPQGVDENEAPDGYKAVASERVGTCSGCCFSPDLGCPSNDDDTFGACLASRRGDRQDVVFVAR